jgi:hypothetical protein
MSNSMTQPVFLVASRRSGTTLFRLMLDGHPDVIWQRGWEQVASATTAFASNQTQILKLDGFDPVKVDSVVGLRNSVETEIGKLLQRNEKRIFGATVHVGFKDLLDIWPEAKFIHLIRDPRDIAMSFLKLGWAGHPYEGANGWEEAERDWDAMLPFLKADQFIDLQYEVLVAEPEAELRQVCKFLGIAYSDQLFNYVETSNYSMPKKELAERWKNRLTEEETRQIESGRHNFMKRKSYKPAYEDTDYSGFQVFWFKQVGIWRLRKKRINERGLVDVVVGKIARKLNMGFLNARLERAATERRRKRLAALEKNY